ncbi:MAG TPA: biopolymer transporter ExbD [Spirochaetota bacterium]|nr:biopolymer transporter ExbD [Spirochaetota bacterium]
MRKGSYLKKLRPLSIGSAMADLALLLLIFFMASTTTEPPKGVEVILPKGTTQGAEQDSLYLTISRNGDIYFDGTRVGVENLHDDLAMRQGEKDRPVAITADKNLDYAYISEVLGILQEQDFLNVVFMSEPRETTPPGR